MIGKIRFRLKLRQVSYSATSRKKRKHGETSVPSQPLTNKESQPQEFPVAAWVFQPLNDPTTEYLLSVPRNLLKRTCDAARYQKTVRLEIYSKFVLSSQKSGEKYRNVPSTLIEVHNDGLKIVQDNECSRGIAYSEQDIWTLTQIRRREAVDKALKTSSSKDTFCLRATVDAISPIITMDPADPFSLMELYEPESMYSCVVVIRKEGLCCHAAILPGDEIVLQGAKRQKWRIPEMLEKKNFKTLKDRVSSHVFVVDKDDQVRWVHNESAGNRSKDTISPSCSIFSTSLTSIQGLVTSVHKINAGNATHIHYLELEAGGDSSSKLRRLNLFLTYFPMSTSLQLSLQPGSAIEAYNLHMLDDWTFCACLRSSVTIVDGHSEAAEENTPFQPMTQPLGQSTLAQLNGHASEKTLSLDDSDPYAFLRIRRSYPEFLCRQRLSAWLEHFKMSKTQKYILPSLDELTETLLPANAKNKVASRNAYAEFFHHGVDGGDSAYRHLPDEAGCHLTSRDVSGADTFQLATLEWLRESALETFKVKLESYLASSAASITIGWTGAVVTSELELLQILTASPDLEWDNSLKISLYTGGFVKGSSFGKSMHFDISNGQVVIPAICSGKECTDFNSQYQFAFVKISSVVLSCICIGRSSLADETDDKHSSDKVSHLPPFQREGYDGVFGACSLLQVDGFIFVVALYLDCSDYHSVPSRAVGKTNGSAVKRTVSEDVLATVSDCLDPSVDQGGYDLFAGLLVRKLFKSVKLKNSEYSGCMMTLAHCPTAWIGNRALALVEVSCAQSIELKPSVDVDERKRLLLIRAFRKFFGLMAVAEKQLTVATVWWKLGSSAYSCALLGGGWDECEGKQHSATAATSQGVQVVVPRSAVQLDERRGYVRFRCRMEELIASPLSVAGYSQPIVTTNTSSLDFIGGSKVLPGMLDRRPRRRTFSIKEQSELPLSAGELIFSPQNSGIPTATLADLNWALCADLKNNTRYHLAPSLVREIRGATFMGITYCRAQAQCTRCYQSLHVPSAKRDNSNKSSKDGVLTSVRLEDQEADERPSFWHIPLPIEHKKNQDLVDRPSVSSPSVPLVKQRNQQTTPLRCPDNCDVELFGDIKWECSGTLDDGTGQAKLYAERDVALTLLGISPSVLESIEAGAWLNENGIVFSKNMPPKAYVREAVMTAKTLAYDQIRRRNKRLEEKHVLQFLTPSARAEYLMQQHCRTSKEPLRELTYYARCKPLSDEVSYLNHTEIEVPVAGANGAAAARNVVTYSLPPLKLNLVDCLATRLDPQDVWDRMPRRGVDTHGDKNLKE